MERRVLRARGGEPGRTGTRARRGNCAFERLSRARLTPFAVGSQGSTTVAGDDLGECDVASRTLHVLLKAQPSSFDQQAQRMVQPMFDLLMLAFAQAEKPHIFLLLLPMRWITSLVHRFEIYVLLEEHDLRSNYQRMFLRFSTK